MGGPGSGPRPGQKNRAGTGKGGNSRYKGSVARRVILSGKMISNKASRSVTKMKRAHRITSRQVKKMGLNTKDWG